MISKQFVYHSILCLKLSYKHDILKTLDWIGWMGYDISASIISKCDLKNKVS